MDIKSEISQNGPNGRTNNNCVNYAVIKKSTLKQNGTNRNFNIELFRIIATSLVLIVHFNDFFVGGVTTNTELSDLCTQDFCQLFIQAISCCCVNCFLVISGWFSIKLKFSALWNLWVILIGVYVPMWLLGIILGANLPIKDLINSIIAFSKESYFIQLYLMLIFLSPMLNTFVEKYNTYLLRYSIIFCSIEFLMEFCFHNKCLYIANGYSLIHFIIMYLLGRAAFIKQDKIKCISARWWFILYFVMVLTIFGSRIFGGGRMVHYAFSYSNPIVICESFFLFFGFWKLSLNSPIINWIASSTLFVFLLQVNSPIYEYLCKIDIYLLKTTSYFVYLLLTCGIIILYFVIATIYGKIIKSLLDRMLQPIKIELTKITQEFFYNFDK